MNMQVVAQTKPSKTSAQPVRSNVLQRKCACGGTPGPTGECERCRKKRLQRKTPISELGTRNDLSVPPIVHEAIRSPGQPLDASTRAFIEPRFGHDFSRVRVHTDARAERAARTIGSEAYTIGSDIVFAAGHFNSTSYSGRSLLAHELAHVVQQRGTTGDDRKDVLSRPSDPGERAADAAAKAVVAGQPVPQQPAFGAATVARKPAGTTKAAEPRPGFLIHVVINEPEGVNGHEFCVRAIMQGHRIGREETEHLLATGRLHCYGWASTRGVGPDWVGHPIPFRIADTLFAEQIGSTAAAAQTTPDPAEEAEVNAETNQRFWARIGDIRKLSKDAPEDAAYRELWKAERAQVLWERHDPFGPELRRLAALGNMPAAASADEIHPWELDAMLEVKTMLAQLTTRDWIRLRRVGLPQTNWQGLAEWLPKFIAEQRADEKVVERVRELDKMGGLASAYGTVHGAGAGSMDPAAPEAFERRDELEQAGKDFRAMFRTRALEKAVETFRGVNAVMDAAANRRLPSRVENDKLYALLQSGKGPEDLSEDVLRRYPVLRDPTTFRVARNTMYASDLGSYLARRAVQCAADAKYLAEHIGEKPEAVFNFDSIVNATLQELGLDDSLYPQILEWGKPDGSDLFSKLLHLGLFVMLFIPGLDVIAITVFAGEAVIGSATAIRDYNEELKKWNRGERADAPSPWGGIWAGFNLGLSLVPFAHLGGAKGVVGAEGLLEQGGRIERLAGETKTLGTVASEVEGRAIAVEGEIATAAREGEGSLIEAATAKSTPTPAPKPSPVPPAAAGSPFVRPRRPTPPASEEAAGARVGGRISPLDRGKGARPFYMSDPKRPIPPGKPATPTPTATPTATPTVTPTPTSSLSEEIASLEQQRARIAADAKKAYEDACTAKNKLSRNKPVSAQEQALINEHDRLVAARNEIDSKLKIKKAERAQLSPRFKTPEFRDVWSAREKQAEQLITDIAGKENVFVKPKIARAGKANLPLEAAPDRFTRLERSRLGLSSNEVTPEFAVRLDDGSVVMVDIKGVGKHSWTKQKYVYEGLKQDGIGVVVVGRTGLPAGSVVDGKVVLLGPAELDQLAASPTLETLMQLLGRSRLLTGRNP